MQSRSPRCLYHVNVNTTFAAPIWPSFLLPCIPPQKHNRQVILSDRVSSCKCFVANNTTRVRHTRTHLSYIHTHTYNTTRTLCVLKIDNNNESEFSFFPCRISAIFVYILPPPFLLFFFSSSFLLLTSLCFFSLSTISSFLFHHSYSPSILSISIQFASFSCTIIPYSLVSYPPPPCPHLFIIFQSPPSAPHRFSTHTTYTHFVYKSLL